MLFEQVRHRERGPRGNERGPLAPHVAARLDRLDHRRVRRRTPDAALFEFLHEARFGVARGRLRLVADGSRALGTSSASPSVTDGSRASRSTSSPSSTSSMYARRHPRKSYVFPDARNDRLLAARRRGREADRHLAAARIDHLTRDRAHPDQLVEALLVAVELAAHGVGAADLVTGRPDRLVRFLRVLDLASGTCAAASGR